MMNSRHSGFTLIELVIAIVVLAILVSMAAPSFMDTLDRRRLLNATNGFAEHVHQARTLSIMLNRNINVEIGSNGMNWGFGVTDKAECDYKLKSPNYEQACSVEMPDNEEVLIRADQESYPSIALSNDDGLTTLTFDPTRGTLQEGSGSLFFTSPRGLKTRVRISVIGRTSICTPAASPTIAGVTQCAS